MKKIRTQKQPAAPGWIAVTTIYPVRIPNLDGTGFSETIEVEIDAWKNPSGELIIPGDVKAELEETKARYMGLLAPDQIRELRQHLGLTQKNISALLQLGEKTWTRWESGRERPSRSMNILLHSLWDGRIDANYLNSLSYPKLRFQPIARFQALRADFTAYNFSTPAAVDYSDEAVAA
ncbi:MAG: helix-turn-helix domain-containing protein [Verrucomicrobia bacterium]|nr:helix-turn-helix domain-containing protein [Verrucomicrobiota bacterium]